MSHSLDRYEERPELQIEHPFVTKLLITKYKCSKLYVNRAVVSICEVDVLIILTKRNV